MNTEQEMTKKAYTAARDAIVKVLGKEEANNCETLLSVAMLLVHYGVTHAGKLSLAMAVHNTKFFVRQLAKLVHQTQKDIDSKSLCGREM